MKRFDYYFGIVLLAALLLLGNYSVEYVNAQRPTRPVKLIRVQKLEIVDENGNTTASFGVEPKGKPYLSLFSKDKYSVSLNTINSDSITIAGDKRGVVLESKPLPGLAIFGNQSKTHAIISLDSTGKGALILLDNNGNVTTSLPPKKGDPLYRP